MAPSHAICTFSSPVSSVDTLSPEAPVELEVTVTTPACEQKFTIEADSGGLEIEVGASQYELAVEPTEPIVVEQCPTTMDPDPLIRIDGCPDGSVAIGETVALTRCSSPALSRASMKSRRVAYMRERLMVFMDEGPGPDTVL